MSESAAGTAPGGPGVFGDPGVGLPAQPVVTVAALYGAGGSVIGPRKARVRQATEIEGVDQRTAEARLDANDGARIAYVHHVYGIDGLDPNENHMVIDSCALDFGTGTDLIVAARTMRPRRPAAGV